LGAGFSRAEASRRALRRHLRQRVALPRAAPGAAARAGRIARRAQARRRALRLEPAREQRGGLESRAVRRVSRPRIMARVSRAGGVRGARALLSSAGPAARATALACKRVAEGGGFSEVTAASASLHDRPACRRCAACMYLRVHPYGLTMQESRATREIGVSGRSRCKTWRRCSLFLESTYPSFRPRWPACS